MGITLWIVLLVIVGVISFTASRNNALAANRTAEKALMALKNNDDTTIYNLGSDDFKKSSDKQKVKDVVNQWSKVIVQATDGKPELVSKRETQKDNKRLTTLEYKYKIKPGKSKIDQKELYVQTVLENAGNAYKLYTFGIDTKRPDSK